MRSVVAPKITTLFPLKTAQIQGGEWKVLKEINDNKLNNLGSAPQSGKKGFLLCSKIEKWRSRSDEEGQGQML
jgi:hypothetical protein